MSNEIEYQTSNNQQGEPVPAMKLPVALLYFGIPAIAVIFFAYGVIPLFEGQGYSPLKSFIGAMTIPMALLFVMAVVVYRADEKRRFSRSAFSERMWFPRLRWRDILLGIIIFIIGMIGSVLLSPITQALVDANLIPQNLPVLMNPTASLSPESLNNAANGEIVGNYEILALYAVYLFFNIAGEELWWRGIILPRQYAAHGRKSWWIHGIMWAFFHAFSWWAIPTILPTALAMAFFSVKTKSNWPATIAHIIANVSLYGMIVATVMGAI